MKQTIVRMNQRPVDGDLEKRILRNVCFMTDSLASDGMIILPAGIDMGSYEQNPIVTYKHMSDWTQPSTIARALSFGRTPEDIVAEIQFADTELGRGLAYLYGLNAEKEVYMRAWSVAGRILDTKTWSWEEAKAYLGKRWDPNMETLLRNRGYQMVTVGLKMDMSEFSAVELGADKQALTRAATSGHELAGQILTRLNLQDAGECLAQLKKQVEASEQKIARLEQEIQALRSEGASAAAQRNSEAVLGELQAMLEMARQN